MSQPETASEEKATGLMHVLRAMFPTVHLAPWMSVHKRQKLFVVSRQSTYSNIGKTLARQTQLCSDRELMDKAVENKELVLHDAAEAFSYFLGLYGQASHDYAPSLDGLGRRQAGGIGSAQKTGVYTEPKKRSTLDWILGRNKPGQQIAGGS